MNYILRRIEVDKLESVTEGTSLSHHGDDVHIAEWQFEFQSNHFADWNLDTQHGGDARRADVDGVTANYRAIARVDADVHLNWKTGMAAKIHTRVKPPISELRAQVQAAFR